MPNRRGLASIRSIEARPLNFESAKSFMNIKRNVPLAPLSTFRIGGRAELFCAVRTPENFIRAVEWAKSRHVPYAVFAGGSNAVFPDKGIKGLLVRFHGGAISVSKNRIVADAGVPLAKVISGAIVRGLGGLETLSGIPGTIGGATVGNAGAYGHSISETVRRVEVWDGKKRYWIKNDACVFGYRESIFKHKPLLVLRTELEFKRGNREELAMVSKKIIKTRNKKYKPGIKCPGSFFKNVLVKDVSRSAMKRVDRAKIIDGKIPAGYLLQNAGAKGMRVGGIRIPDFHGNLFENMGHATARDVHSLADILRKRVKTKFGITLEEEVRYFEKKASS